MSRDDFSAHFRGKAYKATPFNEVVVKNGGVLAGAIITGDCPVLIDRRSLITGCKDFTLNAYDDQVFTGGSVTPMFNRNRALKDRPAEFVIYSGVDTTPVGEPFNFHELSPAAGSEVINFMGDTQDIWILNKNSTYTLVLTNNAKSDFHFQFRLTVRCIQQSEID